MATARLAFPGVDFQNGIGAVFPAACRFRFMLESIRPELRQNFWESETMRFRIREISGPWFIGGRSSFRRPSHLARASDVR